MMPKWFQFAHKMSNYKSQLTDNRGCTITNVAINKKSSFTMFYGLSTTDIDATINASGTATSASNTPGNAIRAYMYNHASHHIWKNNGNTVAILEFYILIPRRDMPVWDAATDLVSTRGNRISPPSTYAYADAVKATPAMYTQGFADMAATDSSLIKVAHDDISATPYMSPPIASAFKIKRLRVNGPSGKSSMVTLEPGKECSLQVKHSKPRLCNYSKYSLNSTVTATVAKTYEVLRETPLIFCYIRGGIGHEQGNVGNVAATFAYVDYMCKRHWERLFIQPGATNSVQLVTSTTFVGAAEETNAYGGAQVVVEADV